MLNGRGVFQIQEPASTVFLKDDLIVSHAPIFSCSNGSFMAKAAPKTIKDEIKVRKIGALTAVSAVMEKSIPIPFRQELTKEES